jgi:hypothetical protein
MVRINIHLVLKDMMKDPDLTINYKDFFDSLFQYNHLDTLLNILTPATIAVFNSIKYNLLAYMLVYFPVELDTREALSIKPLFIKDADGSWSSPAGAFFPTGEFIFQDYNNDDISKLQQRIQNIYINHSRHRFATGSIYVKFFNMLYAHSYPI